MDLKQNPLYEDTDMALLDTHYYGGVKKYQWVTIPLALHGVIVKKDGTKVVVNVGDKPQDPVFGVSDLLIHLSADQLDKKGAKVIEGEQLDVLIGRTRRMRRLRRLSRLTYSRSLRRNTRLRRRISSPQRSKSFLPEMHVTMDLTVA